MIVACDVCRWSTLIRGRPEEVKYLLSLPEWSDSMPCITDLCRGRARRSPRLFLEDKRYNTRELPVRNYYRALLGFGTGEVDPAPTQEVVKELLTKKVVQVLGSPVGQPERTILEALVLEDGTRLHFGKSTQGACVYRIERPGKSCVEVFDETSGEDPGRSEPGREEAGRDPEPPQNTPHSGVEPGTAPLQPDE